VGAERKVFLQRPVDRRRRGRIVRVGDVGAALGAAIWVGLLSDRKAGGAPPVEPTIAAE